MEFLVSSIILLLVLVGGFSLLFFQLRAIQKALTIFTERIPTHFSVEISDQKPRDSSPSAITIFNSATRE